MGKVKRVRQKAHNAAVKANSNKEKNVVDSQPTLPPATPHIPVLGENVFAGLDLKKYNLKTELPDNFDTRSAITSKSLKELKIKKKDKRKLRHDMWIKKLNATEAVKKKEKETKKKQQTPVVGDIGILAEALPTLDLFLKSMGSKNKQQPEGKPKSTQKTKTRQKQMLKDISIFNQVLKHPQYKQDPTSTMAEHLKNWQKQEEMEET